MELKGHTDYINWVAFSSDAAYIASALTFESSDATLRVWDTRTGAQLAVLENCDALFLTFTFLNKDQQILIRPDITQYSAEQSIWDWTHQTESDY